MDGLGEAVDRWKGSQSEPSEEAPPPADEGSGDGGGKGHTFHVHHAKDGKHHLTVHGDNGQLVHHSEHGSLEEAAEEMKKHGEHTTVD